MGTGDCVATLQQVDFSFAKRPVFTGLDWQIKHGITALMGPNGAGKTTLLRLVAGSLKPAAGSIDFEERQVARVGYLPQRYSFVHRMRVREAVGHAAWSSGINRPDLDEHVNEALGRVDLTTRAGDRVGALSGGQQQRLAIACTLSARPAVLLLDEPSVGLDPIQRRNLRNLLRDLGPTTPIVLSTHLVDDVAQIADQITVLDGGKVLYDGATAAFVAGRTLEDAYVDTVSSEET